MNTVLFSCIHNAGRSQMAAAWFNALADGSRARAISAGTEPAARVHPEVLSAMREVGIDLEGIVPQKLTGELAAKASVLVTMGCGEACPVVPGLRRMDWALEDPRGKPVERVREIRDDVKSRVTALLAAEGWTKVEAAALVRPARAGDRAGVARLLDETALPAGGLDDQFPAAFVVATRDGELAGCAGLEVHGGVGLLRSVVVAPASRGRGVGRALVADRIAAARGRGLEAAYLLTTTASDYFARLGFTTAERAAVPSLLAASPEFAGACPASAICMMFDLGRGDSR